jgi:hypothetical protein
MDGQMIQNDNLPKSMRYGLASATAVQASASLARFSSINGTSFSPTGSNQIRFKVQAPGFLDAEKHYLQMKITATGDQSQIDTNIGSVIDRMRIEANGAVVEEINSYHLYNAIRHYYNADQAECYKLAAESGAAALEAKQGATHVANQPVEVVRGAAGEVIADGNSKVLCVQLQSGLLKNVHKKALPEGLVELDIILTLAGNAVPLVSATAVTYTIDDPVIFCPMYKIESGDVMSAYRNIVQQEGRRWTGVTAKTYINNVAQGAGTKNLQINDRSLSCLGMVTALRAAAVNTDDAKYSTGAFGFFDGATGKVSQFKYQIGGVNYPASDINIEVAADGKNVARAHEESLKALARPGSEYAEGSVGQNQLTTSINQEYAEAATKSADIPHALLSVSLKKFDDSMLQMRGLNTSMNSSPNVLEFTHTAFSSDLNATTFALCESFYTMLPTGQLVKAD